MPGLNGPVTILRDTAGIPHIYASGFRDLFFAQGYVTAQDRLWQMETNRRTAWGRLSEVFGEAGLEADLLFRSMGLGRVAQAEEQALDGETRAILQAYADGVNAYVAHLSGVLPLEFTLLRVDFEPWRPVDSLAWGKMMAWELSTNWATEVRRAALVAKLDPQRTAELMPSVPPGVVPQVPAGLDLSTLGLSALRRLDNVTELVRPSSQGMESNNWVVSGSRTDTGLPFLANDPHLGIQIPAIWYEVHLVGADFDVAGLSMPGSPGVIIGHNRHIAWGVTNTGADVQDLYVERANPDNPGQFLYKGAWEDAQIVRETIAVRGRSAPVELAIPYTRHGPIINADAPDEPPLALRWTALEPSSLPRSVIGIDRASNWQEFRTSLGDFSSPSQNFVYADTDGNIGYQMSGSIPVRAKGDGLLPVPGWTGEYEWDGYVPFSALPSKYNPPEGLLFTANDRVVGDDYPYLITYEWAPGFRAERIKAMLAGRSSLSLQDMRAAQLDI
ncbi:MAG: penicillin acylase family protein [Chloroflexota bacterium]